MFLKHKKINLGNGFEEHRARELYRCVPVLETREDRIRPSELCALLKMRDLEFWTKEQGI